ncbi:hypothetical protein [Chromobacterium amazonense]|uniref:Rad50/SbcC-type AAA domain-containing protein n=1 Tax=Chromobacterium amazonense TaxID=1382803 RepID=A0ABU8V2I0_9NEIS|nr:hypothetical protein [Chromobacterium amazonense]MDQ4538863.1 hypothetical protein [Chromobacterium amazonense]
MLGLKLENLKISVITKDEEFGVSIPFENGLNIIRAENSSGKSTVINSIAYALGLDATLGPSSHSPFPNSVKYAISKNKKNKNEIGLNVIDSFIDLTLYNSANIKIQLRRYINGNNKKITVTDENGESIDYFLGSAGNIGSAKNDRGFHYWLERFIGWKMPAIPKFDGSEGHLYLECIFPLFFIEQKRGWSEIQANTPSSFQLKDIKKTAIEFCLGVTDFQKRNEVEKYKKIIAGLKIDWEKVKSSLQTLAELHNLKIEFNYDIDSNEWLDFSTLYYLSDGNQTPIGQFVTSLKRRIKDLNYSLQGWSFSAELDELINSRRITTRKLILVSERSDSLHQSMIRIDKKLKLIESDTIKYKQLRRLISVGAENGIILETENCPICNTNLKESFTAANEHNHPLTIDQNITYLEEQRKFYLGLKNKTKEELINIENEKAAISTEVHNIENKIKLYKNEEKEYLSTFGEELKSIAELNITKNEYEKIILQKEKLNKLAESISREYRNTYNSLEIAKKDLREKVSSYILNSLKEKLIGNLSDFSYQNNNINWLKISEQTYRPELDGFDIVADTSASDYIRIIWSYTLALLELGIEINEVKHGGFVVFDEPRQHETSHNSFEALLNKSAEKFKLDGQVIIATSIPSKEILPFKEKGANVIIFEDGEYMLNPIHQ